MKKEFVIYNKMLEINSWLFAKIITFPKQQRFVLGQQLQNCSLNCARLIIEANNSRDPRVALIVLDKLNNELGVLRHLLEIAHNFGFMKINSLTYIIKQIDEVGKMRGGWAKHYISSKNDNCVGAVQSIE